MMPDTATRNYSNNCASAYKEQEITMSSPEKCVLHLYDAAIQGCAMGQEERAGRAIALLIDGLNFQAGGEVAPGLFGLYEYCLRLIHRQQFDGPIKILKELRDAWQKAMAETVAA